MVWEPKGFANQVDDALAQLRLGWGIPTDWYHRDDLFQFEMSSIYEHEWQYFAPTVQLLSPGDYVVGRVSNVPIFVTRTDKNELQGFVNMCRHRGHPVLAGTGSRSSFVCPYHGWTYGLDGSLVRAPDCHHESNFNMDELGLIPIAVDSWGPAVFVNLDNDAPNFNKAHPRFDETWRSRGLTDDLDAFQFRRRVEYDANANWKLWYDNNVECYHCPRIHGSSFAAAYDVSPDKVDNYELDRLMTYKFLVKQKADGDELVTGNYRSMQLFPGITIVQQDDLMILSQMIPLSADRTISVMDYFVEKGCDESRFERWIALWDQTFREDLIAVRNQQTGMQTGRLERSRFMQSKERPAIFINETILNAYRKGLAVV